MLARMPKRLTGSRPIVMPVTSNFRVVKTMPPLVRVHPILHVNQTIAARVDKAHGVANLQLS
jgi:hypothetical protein